MKIPVFIETTVSKFIGYIEIDNPGQFKEAAEKLWGEQDIPPLRDQIGRLNSSDWGIEDCPLEYYFKDRAFIPECCKSCEHLDSEQEDYKPETFYCQKNIVFPTKKQTCEKQSK